MWQPENSLYIFRSSSRVSANELHGLSDELVQVWSRLHTKIGEDINFLPLSSWREKQDIKLINKYRRAFPPTAKPLLSP